MTSNCSGEKYRFRYKLVAFWVQQQKLEQLFSELQSETLQINRFSWAAFFENAIMTAYKCHHHVNAIVSV